MGFFDWFHSYREAVRNQAAQETARIEASIRRCDPDYDERLRLRYEQNELTRRRDLLRQREENAALQAEIAELERRDGVPALDANGLEAPPDYSGLELETEFQRGKWWRDDA